MPKNYQKTKKSFVKVSNNPPIDPNESKSRKVPCYCNKCKGLLIDLRTKRKHDFKRNISPRRIIENMDQDLTNDNSNQDGSVNLLINNPNFTEVDLTSSDDDQIEINRSIPQEENYTFLPKKVLSDKPKGKQKGISSSSRIKYPIIVIEQNISDDDGDNNDYDENDQNDNNLNFVEENPNEHSSSGFDVPETEDLYDGPKRGTSYLMLLLSTDSLVKFLRYLLILLDANTFDFFPTSLYMARKTLGICAHIIKYAACEKCCKLYDVAEVSNINPNQVPVKSHCIHIDLPNHPMANQKNECMTKLTKTVHTINGTLYRHSLIFPTISLKHQLQLMYNRKGFESSCRKWADRYSDSQYLNDIYNGRVWKTFWDQDQNLPFFRKEVADRNLGIMINIDWFQPFDNANYSVGAVYGVICNLPRSERFKPSNILTMALIPGPNSQSINRIMEWSCTFCNL
ncbi:hypothetical protein RhiirA4_452039 [Rhizophagus irregularis]|uniref:Transposase domain-containing protein n=1 Tax=Rhizophagus irregularis TaxID=588596 RepID=A0A2I1FX15_9GLOM|nr:hypothetical protein RhiirA4_452039 [Rhizophagus irregularis]